jgi:hypothetical protein
VLFSRRADQEASPSEATSPDEESLLRWAADASAADA